MKQDHGDNCDGPQAIYFSSVAHLSLAFSKFSLAAFLALPLTGKTHTIEPVAVPLPRDPKIGGNGTARYTPGERDGSAFRPC